MLSCLKRKKTFITVLLAAVIMLIAACAGYQHGYTMRKYQGQWLNLAKDPSRPMPGDTRLKIEREFDGALDVFVESKGLPDYIHVIDLKNIELVYLSENKVYRFKRSTFGVNGKLIKTYPAAEIVEAGFISESIQVGNIEFDKTKSDGQKRTSADKQKVALDSSPSQGLAKKWAVIIGISKYQFAGHSGLTNLVFADDDAKAFAHLLKKLGWNQSHIKLLVNEKATRRNVMIAFESWLSKAGTNDQIVLFWAGHGYPDPEDPEKVYLACYDTDISIPATGYRMDRVRMTLEERRARNVVLLADTCHAGKLITRGDRGLSIVSHIKKMDSQKKIPPGWIFMVGADTDRLAIENSSWSNGAFTHCLLRGLSGGADGFQSVGPKDGVVNMGELRAYLNTVMPDETQKVLGVAKRPVITTSSGDIGIWDLNLQPYE